MSATPEDSLNIEVRREGPVAVVEVRGSAGMYEAEKLRDELRGLLEESPRLIVLEMGGMDFICSTGLGALIEVQSLARKQNAELRLVGPQRPVLDVLETTRLTKLFPVFPTVEEAKDAEQDSE